MFEHVQSVNLRQKALFDAGQKKQEAAGPIVNWKQREEGLATSWSWEKIEKVKKPNQIWKTFKDSLVLGKLGSL